MPFGFRVFSLASVHKREVPKIAKHDDTRINDEITATRCRLIGVDGSQLGLFGIRDAQRVADEQGLDLVEIAPNADPPVCRVMTTASSSTSRP